MACTSGFLVIILWSCCCVVNPKKIYITDQGPNSFTINSFCQNTSDVSNVIVDIHSGIHKLDMFCEIENANNVTLKSQNRRAVIRCGDYGFRFLNVSQLVISNIEFLQCGVVWHIQTQLLNNLTTFSAPANFSSLFVLDQLSALVFVNGSDLSLIKVRAISTGIYIYNVAGNVVIDSCEVKDKTMLHESVIVYDSLVSEHVSVRVVNSLITSGGLLSTKHLMLAGLAFLLGAPKLTVILKNTTLRNNSGSLGGNMVVLMYDLASITIEDTIFSGGNAYLGGGLFVSLQGANYTTKRGSLSIVDSKFVANRAKERGGGVYVEWENWSNIHKLVSIDIVNTAFTNNFLSAAGGFGLHLQAVQSSNPERFSHKLKVNVIVSDCMLSSNNPDSLKKANAVIVADGVPFLRINGTTVKSNNCTGILSIGSDIVFSGSTQITDNIAVIGGGLRLYNAFIYLAPDTDLIITDNFAEKTGGGIMLHEPPGCLWTGAGCFFRYDSETSPDSVNFTISGNHAVEGGDNVFGCPLFECDFNKYQLRMPSNTRTSSSVSSKATEMCLDSSCSIHSMTIRIYPGEKFTFPVYLFGEEKGNLAGSVIATSHGIKLKEMEQYQNVGMSGSSVTYTLYYANSKNASLLLVPGERSCCTKNNKVQVQVEYYSCPLGFNMTEVGACQCDSSIPVISKWSIQSKTITKRRYSWLGMFELHNRSYLATSSFCPFDYCLVDFQDIKSGDNVLYQDEQCQYNRTGVLCGSCPKGWSLVLGSSECRKECSNRWLLLVLPFALAGILLVAFMHLLNLSVTMGTISGIIFYANVIQDYSVIMMSKYSIPGLTTTLQIFLSWLNLDLGISVCFYNGMEAFGKSVLLFAFPLYIWLVSATIIVLSNRYIFFTRLVGENAVKVLSTLFLLSYSKILHAAVSVLYCRTVSVYTNHSLTRKIRWAIDGNIPYLDPQRHCPLVIVAVSFILLLLPFSISLLCIRHIYSLSKCCRVFSKIDKLKPFFDAYTGPYKDSGRFWTGLLLLVRVLLLVVRVLDFTDDVIPYYAIVGVCFALLTIMILLRGIYKNWHLNILEHFFILNIGITCLIYTYQGGHNEWRLVIVVHLLVSLAFIAFLGILVYHIYVKFSHLICKRTLQQNAETVKLL